MPRAAPPVPGHDLVRPYTPSIDAKTVQMLIGQGVMEGLARANQRVYRHPFVLLLWVILALTLDYTLDWLPHPSVPLSYVSPLIGFALAALPLLAGVEYMQRPGFTRLLRHTLGAPDLVAMERYYSLDPRSRVLVFEHKGELVGVIALDGSSPGTGLGSVLGAEEGELGEKEGVVEQVGFEKKDQSAVPTRQGLRRRHVQADDGDHQGREHRLVQIRHLDVDIPVRRAGIATELLVAALDHAFATGPQTTPSAPIVQPADKVIVLTNPLSTGGEKVFRKCGFGPVGENQADGWSSPIKIGLFGWRGRWLALSRSAWEAKREVLFVDSKT